MTDSPFCLASPIATACAAGALDVGTVGRAGVVGDNSEAEQALIAEFDRLREEPVSEGELQRAKNQFFRDYILERESIRGKSMQLAHAVVIHHDITTADGEFEIFQNITAADVQRVARTYFTPENRLVLTVMPGRQTAGGR